MTKEATSNMGQETRFPLSAAQRRLWFLNKLEPDLPVYNIPMQLTLKGKLDIDALSASMSELVKRHEVLRTRFEELEGQPAQVISPAEPLQIPVIDLTELAGSTQENAVKDLVNEEEERVFDLSEGHLIRVTVLRLDEEDHVLLLTMHHIISDGWSMGVLVREMTSLYKAYTTGSPPPLEELAIQYVDYSVWQEKWLQGEVVGNHLDYWKKHLARIPPLLELGADRNRPAMQSYRGRQERFVLSSEIAERLKQFSRVERASLFMVLLTGFKVLLRRYSGQDDISVGTPVFGRNRRELEGLIGFFVNTLVLRTQVKGEMSFRELLTRERETLLEAYAHQEAPFEKVVEHLSPERSLSHSPLFQVMFQLDNKSVESIEVEGLKIDVVDVEGGTSRFDLTLIMREGDQGLTAVMEYNTDLYDAATIGKLLSHYGQILEEALLDPDKKIVDIELLNEQERNRLVDEWNDREREYPRERSIPEILEEEVERHPDRVALVFNDQHITYGDLNGRANQLAHLLRGEGVSNEVLVGLCLDKSIEMVISLLGILKSAGAYVPLDPQYPMYRTALVLDDSQTSLVVTESGFTDILPEGDVRLIVLDREFENISQCPDDNLPRDLVSKNLSHVIYTSGSTGIPKGVQIEHRSVVALREWAKGVYSEEELSGVLAATSICFDLSVFEILVTLTLGGTVILPEDVLRLEEKRWGNGITLINTVPSIMTELVRSEGVPESVLTVNLAGEALKSELVRKVYREGGAGKVYNLYGPSEDTTYSTFALIDAVEEPNCVIGKPIDNTKVYILDQEKRLQPTGVIGELHITGEGLSRGYMNKPDLTAESFIPNPFSKSGGERLYCTGDLVRYSANGNISFIRRKDEQVKVRGYRIELGEIESILNEHYEVKDAAVIVKEDFAGQKRLVGYLVMRDGAELMVSDMRSYLKEKLPEYMVPGLYVQLDEMPLKPNGKLDKSALPEPLADRGDAQNYQEPRTEVEKNLANIWKKVLGVEKIGIDDNFFELGGHSLLGSQVISAVMTDFGVELPLRVVFESPTIEQMSLVIIKALTQGQDYNLLNDMLTELEQLPDFSDNL